MIFLQRLTKTTTMRSAATACVRRQYSVAAYNTFTNSSYGENTAAALKHQNHHISMSEVESRSLSTSAFRPTNARFAKESINLPSVGGSDSEGTVVQWLVKIGEPVSDGDVVALIKIDGNDSEVKAPKGGVVTQHFSKANETVKAGSPLFEIDTDPDAAANAARTAKKTMPEGTDGKTPRHNKLDVYDIDKDDKGTGSSGIGGGNSGPTAVHSGSGSGSGKNSKANNNDDSDAVNDSTSVRTPLIHFLGKEGWQQRLAHGNGSNEGQSNADTENVATTKDTKSQTSSSSPTTPSKSSSPHAVTVLEATPDFLNPLYGRPPFTDDEIEALILGGASLAPEVLRLSGGATFKVKM